MALLIDTDLIIDLERGAGAPAVEELLGDEDRAISVITLSELLHGVLRAGRTRSSPCRRSRGKRPPGASAQLF